MDEIDVIISENKKVFENDFSGHDIWHTLRVYKTALKIADTEKCDKRVISIAALLHDVDDSKLFIDQNHNNAVRIMKRACVEDITITKAINIIENVSFKGIESTVLDSIEGKIVQDADRLDALGAIGIARAFALDGAKGRVMYDPDVKSLQDISHGEYINNRGTTVNHFYE